jgi:hypothetical protein
VRRIRRAEAAVRRSAPRLFDVDVPTGRGCRYRVVLQLARDDVLAEEIQTTAQVGFDLAALNGSSLEGGRFRPLHKLSAKCLDLWDFRQLELRREPADYKLEIKCNSGCAAAVESVYRCVFPEDRRYINIPRQGRSGLNDTRMLL